LGWSGHLTWGAFMLFKQYCASVSKGVSCGITMSSERRFTPAPDAAVVYADARRRYLAGSAALLPTFDVTSA